MVSNSATAQHWAWPEGTCHPGVWGPLGQGFVVKGPPKPRELKTAFLSLRILIVLES